MKQFILTLFILVATITSCSDKKTKTQEFAELSGEELKIVAQIYLKPDAFKSMKPAFEKLIAGSQAEEGCLYYDLHIDVTDTSNTRFVMLEAWENQAAIDAHNKSEHYKNFQKAAKDYVDSTVVTVLKISK